MLKNFLRKITGTNVKGGLLKHTEQSSKVQQIIKGAMDPESFDEQAFRQAQRERVHGKAKGSEVFDAPIH